MVALIRQANDLKISISEVNKVVSDKAPYHDLIKNTSHRKLFSFTGYDGFTCQLCDYEVLAVRFSSEAGIVTRVLADCNEFENLVYKQLDGVHLLGFFAIPDYSKKETVSQQDQSEEEPNIITTIRRPVEDLVFAAIRRNHSVSFYVD